MNLRFTSLLCGLAVLSGCAEEVPPPSVEDYLADPIALEAAVVRCAANRSETRYDAECVNARQAVSIIEARKDRERREAFEAESAAKFGELPPDENEEAAEDETAVNAPGAVLPPTPEEPPASPAEEAPAVDGGNAPVVDTESPADLDAVREELRRRNEESGN